MFSLLLMKRHQKKKLWFQLESLVAQRSARVNKNSYKKPFTFPSYKIYLWGILPGKSLTETKDCLARMSWLDNIQNMWSVRDPRSHSQGLCSLVPWPLLPFLLPHDIYQVDPPDYLSIQGDPLKNMRKSKCSVNFSFLVGSIKLQCLLSFWLFQSFSKSFLQLALCPALFGYLGAEWPQRLLTKEQEWDLGMSLLHDFIGSFPDHPEACSLRLVPAETVNWNSFSAP